MTKILFIGGNLSQNEGGTALVITAYESLKKVFPNLKVHLLSFRIESDLNRKDKFPYITIISELLSLPVPVISSWIYRLLVVFIWKLILKVFKINIKKLISESVLQEYENSDFIIEISGDGLSGDYGLFSTLISLSRLWVGILMEKSVVIYAQSIGPFNIKWPYFERQSKFLSRLIQVFAKYILNNVSLITVREEITLDILNKIGVKKPPIHLTADSAFLLAPIAENTVDTLLYKYGIHKNDNLIGISISNSINKLQYNSDSQIDSEYFKNIMIKIIEHAIKKYDFKVILIPHVTGPGLANDDRVIAQEIYERYPNKEKVTLLLEEFDPKELKGIIKRCEVFIGSRMHANIAALSTGVPTIAVGYSHKTKGIMDMMNQNNLIFDLENLSLEEIISRFDYCIKNKDKISVELNEETKKVQQRSLQNAILIKELSNFYP